MKKEEDTHRHFQITTQCAVQCTNAPSHYSCATNLSQNTKNDVAANAVNFEFCTFVIKLAFIVTSSSMANNYKSR